MGFIMFSVSLKDLWSFLGDLHSFTILGPFGDYGSFFLGLR